VKIREPFNAISHAVGAVLTSIGAIYLLTQGSYPAITVGFAIYGLMATLLFSASAIYHWTHEAKPALQKFDHASIYLMIAGSYTPICLVGFQEKAFGVSMLVIQWTLALIGIITVLTMKKQPTWLRLTLYLLMGWMVLPLVGKLFPALGASGLAWMFAGGLAYTFGAVIYASKKPFFKPGVFSFHEVWHLCVMAGAACHFMVMLRLLTV
jgi:hemolysin III